jgi:hypothetical protein
MINGYKARCTIYLASNVFLKVRGPLLAFRFFYTLPATRYPLASAKLKAKPAYFHFNFSKSEQTKVLNLANFDAGKVLNHSTIA